MPRMGKSIAMENTLVVAEGLEGKKYRWRMIAFLGDNENIPISIVVMVLRP